jgi:hypothetical protein
MPPKNIPERPQKRCTKKLINAKNISGSDVTYDSQDKTKRSPAYAIQSANNFSRLVVIEEVRVNDESLASLDDML